MSFAPFAATACAGQTPSVIPTEPIQLPNGQFIAGALPGMPPWVSVDGSAQDPAELTHRAIDTGNVLGIAGPTAPLAAGARGLPFSGLATPDSVAIGIALADAGTGYWVVPVMGLDTFHAGWVAWSFVVNFNPADPPGPHKLRLVAIDDAGKAGRQVDLGLCINPVVPDNRQLCIPVGPDGGPTSPPAAVISLHWDDNFDLDLHVVAPNGTDINAKNPAGSPLEGGAPAAGAPVIDRDSLGSCIPDGLRREDVIFQNPPMPGFYRIYVDPFAACGQAAVRFTLDVYALAGACPHCGLQSTLPTQSGELLSTQATGGATTGLFIQQVELPQGL